MPLSNKKALPDSEGELAQKVRKRFKKLFKEEPLLIRSPGRVNLIGEHTDYNEGFVLPAAVDKAIYFAIKPRNDGTGSLVAHDLGQNHEFELNRLAKSDKRWPNYLLGVVDQLQKKGCKVGGFNCVFGGDIPIGSGMSSSAAIEAGLAFALNGIFGLGLDSLRSSSSPRKLRMNSSACAVESWISSSTSSAGRDPSSRSTAGAWNTNTFRSNGPISESSSAIRSSSVSSRPRNTMSGGASARPE